MSGVGFRPLPALVVAVGALLAVEALALPAGAVVHLGVRIPLGVVVLEEPRIVPATVVEGLCGLALLGSAHAVFARKSRAWTAAVVAQTVALGRVLLGTAALAAGAGPNTASNALFHRVMLVALVGGLVLLATPVARAAFRHGRRTARVGAETGG